MQCLFCLLVGVLYNLIANYSLCWKYPQSYVAARKTRDLSVLLRRCRDIKEKLVGKKFKPQFLNRRTNAASHLFLLWKELWLSNHISPYKCLSLAKPRWTLARRNLAPAFLRGKNIPVLVTHTKSCDVFINSVFSAFQHNSGNSYSCTGFTPVHVICV